MAEAVERNTEPGGRCLSLRQFGSRLGNWAGSLCGNLGRALRFRRRQYIEDYDEPEIVLVGMNDEDLSVPSIHGLERHQRPLTLTARTRTKPRAPTLIAIQQALGEIDTTDAVATVCGVSIAVKGDVVGKRSAGGALQNKQSCEEVEEELCDDVESLDDLDLK